jgi:hypothetical protein
MTTRPHWQALCERLRAGNMDLDRAIERGSVVYFDAADAAALIAGGGVANGRPLLQQMVESAAAATGKPQPQVAVFSECAPHLCAAGHVEAALGLEDLGNEFLRLQPIDFLCAYPLEPPDRMPAFRQIFARHSAIAVR